MTDCFGPALARGASFTRSHLAAILMGLFLLSHVPYFAMRVSGEHRWRQSDMAAVSRNYVQESFNFFLPRVDIRGRGAGIVGMELPIYNFIVAILYFSSGTLWEGLGKLLAFLFGVVFLWILTKTLRLEPRVQTIAEPTLFAAVLLGGMLSPFFFRYTGIFVPNTMALCLGMFGFYSYYRFLAAMRGWGFLAATFGGLALGGLIRPYVLLLGLPLLSVWLFSREVSRTKRILTLIAGGSILLLVAGWYGIYVPYVSDRYGWRYFFFGNYYLDGGLAANVRLLGSADMWLGVFEILCKKYLGYPLLAVFALGTATFFFATPRLAPSGNHRKLAPLGPLWQMAFAALATLLMLPLIVGDHIIVHYYYLAPMLPFLFAGLSVGVVALTRWRPLVALLVGAAAVVFLALDVWPTYFRDGDLRALDRLRPQIQARTTKDDLFVVDGTPTYLYAVERKGWYMDLTGARARGELAKYFAWIKARGARFALLKIMDGPDVVDFELAELR